MYLLLNQNDFTFGFSPKDVKERFGMCEDTARNAFNKLIDKNYLTLEPNSKNRYVFTDAPNKVIILDDADFITKQFNINGVIHSFSFMELKEFCKKYGKDDEFVNKMWEEN